MPYWRLFYHFVWSTQNREPIILKPFETTLHKVIAAKAIKLGGIVHAVGGTSDHIHLVASIPPRISLSDFIGQVKGNSSHFVNHKLKPEYQFAWQNEYGVISFGKRQLRQIVRYVLNQHKHHGQGTVLEQLERTVG